MTFKSISFLTGLLFILQIGTAGQSSKKVYLDIWVAGCCAECVERIEKTMDTKGIKNAHYHLDNHRLHLVFNPSKISEDEIHRLLNTAGHDTEKSLCTQAEYNQMDDCCRYREKGVTKKELP